MTGKCTVCETGTAKTILAKCDTCQTLVDFQDSIQSHAIGDIMAERNRQDAKWGEQNHDPITWVAILTEAVGELAQAVLQSVFGGPAADGLRHEAIQCAAVALAIIECLDRHNKPPVEEDEINEPPPDPMMDAETMMYYRYCPICDELILRADYDIHVLEYHALVI